MSTEIDHKVVEMRFDNKDFERNVSTTMSTLDKLKQKLSFKGHEKSFDGLTKAAKSVDLTAISDSADKVGLRFDALYTVADQAFRNITNSAMAMSKNLVKSLSVDQITAGLSKYEQKTASVQTIMNATGKSIDEVNGYLEKLMWFSDETSYGFTDMTAALGQMTSSGGDIEKLIPLITGVANATAYAGKGASEFSRVMYNLNQSYGAGYLQLMDWKSLELAGVGSKQLKQTFIDTAVAMGKIKEGEVTVSNFSQSLKDKWADTQVMEAAFGKFGEFSDAVHQMVASGEAETASEAIEKLSGQYGELGETAFKSAQEAKSFTEAIDATKDAVSSGWMKTFELLFGNYEQAKVLWTDLANTLWDVFASGGESRNALLEEALTHNPFEALLEKVDKVTGAIEAPIKKLEEYEDIVNRIINGEFGNGQSRWDKLAEAGYDWAHAQNLVNEKLGSSVRHATDYVETQSDMVQQTVELTDAKLEEVGLTKEEIKLYRELEAEAKKTGKTIGEVVESMKMEDGRSLLIGSFKNIGSGILGFINSIKEAFADIFPPMTAVQLYNLIKGFNELTSKLRLTDAETGELNETGQKLKRTFKGVFAAIDIVLTVLGGPFKLAVKVASKILSSMGLGILDVTANVGDAIVAFRDWVDEILDWDKIFDHLGTLFAPMVTKVREFVDSFRSLSVVQNTLERLKGVFNKEFISKSLINGLNGLWNILEAIARGIKKCYDAFMSLPAVQNGIKKVSDVFTNIMSSISKGLGSVNMNSFVDGITKFFDVISELFTGLGDKGQDGEHLISGLTGAIGSGLNAVISAITEICTAIYNTFTSYFGIHSPSKVFFTLGKFCIAGLVAGLLFAKNDTQTAMGEVGGSLLDGLKTAVTTVVDTLKAIDFGKVFAVAGAVAMFKTVHDMIKVMDSFGAGAKAFGEGVKQFSAPFASAAKVIDAFAEKINPKKDNFTKIADNVLKLAGAIAILAGAVFLLAQVEPGKLWGAVGAIAALAAIMGVLSFALSKMGSAPDSDYGKLALSIIAISGALFIMAMAIKKLDFITKDNVLPIVGTVVALIGGMTLMLVLFGKFVKGKAAQNIDKAGITLLKMSAVMLLLATTIKVISKLEPDALQTGLGTLLLFGAFVVGLMAATRLAGKRLDACGTAILKLSAAILLMVFTTKQISKLEPTEIAKGVISITMFGGIITGLIAATKLVGGKDLTKLGSTLIGISGAILIMVLTSKLLARMNPGDMIKGALGIALFGGIITGLIAATKLAGGTDLKGVPATLLSMTICIGMMAAIAVVLSLVSLPALAKGITAVSMLGAIVALMIWATRGATDCKANIIAMTTAIGIMAASVFVLSLIDTAKLATATGAISLLMGMFALIIKATGSAGKAIGNILVMTVAIGMIAGMLYLLTEYTDCAEAAQAAIAISSVMVAMSAALKFISKIKMDKNVLGAIGGLTIMCGLLVGFAWALSTIPDITDKTPSIITLAETIAAMTILLAAITAIGKIGNIGQMASGILGLTLMCGLLVGFAFALSTIPNVSDKNATIQTLVITMGALSVLLLALTGIGSIFVMSGGIGALCGLAGIGGLIVMLGTMMLFATALDKIPDLSGSIPTITMLTNMMVLMTGLLTQLAIIGPFAMIGVGALAGITGLMIAIGTLAVAVGALMDKFPALEEFLDKGMPILEKLANGLGSILGNFISGFATGVMSGLPEIGLMLSQFMTNATGFIVGAKMVDESVKEGVSTLVKAILALTVANFVEGIASFMQFGSSFASLGTELSAFMINAMPFILGTKLIDPAAIEGAKNLANMILTLTAADILDGLTSWLTGGVSIADFGAQIAEFGPYLATFSESVAGIDTNAVNTAAKAGKTMAEMADTIPADWNHNNLKKFGEQLGEFGDDMADFSSKVDGKVNSSEIKNAAKGAKALAEVADAIPADWNHNNLKKFGEQLVSFAGSLTNFSIEISGNTGAISSSATAVKDFMEQLGTDIISKFAETLKTPNNIITTAISTFISGVATTLASHKNERSTFYTNAKDLGKYLVEGFAKGIKNNTRLAEDAVTALTDAAQRKANANLKVNSPSKVFMVTGGSVVEGFAKGIKDNLGDIKKSAIELGNTMLKATQDNLEINSPSLVFDKKVGRYVVQGIAKGISKETAAEKAAKEKASAIVEVFQKELDKIGTESGIAEKIFNNWLNGEGKYAADDVVDSKELEYLTGELTRAEKRQSWAYNEWQETVAHLGEGSVDERKAWDKYLAEQGNVIDAQNKISDVQQRSFDRRYEAIENEQALADAQYNLWSATNEATARDVEKDAKHLTYLNDNLKRLNSRVLVDVEAYNKAIELYGKESDEAKVALIKCLETDKEIVDTQNEIAEVHINSVNKMIDGMDSIAAMRNLDYDLWLSGDGRNATEAAKDAKQIAVLRENAKTYNDEVKALKLEYDRLVRLYGTGEATAEQVMEAERNLKNKMIERNNINNDIEDLLENENARMIRQHELASNNADLEYQIWEKTAGRKATSAEKDIARLVVLSKQLSSSTAIVNAARDEWTKAINKYGRSSNEAQEAYSEYLNKQLDLANIQNEITDINENTVKRQRLAQSEYQDYIEKYKKFYSENGMSQEQLENDAKLITGYNPNSTVNTMIGRTNDALEKVTDTPEYNELVNNFKTLGLSYVDAVNEGVESETSIVVNTVATMVRNCITAIKDTKMSWLEAGRPVVLGFSEGIRLSIQQAVEAAVLLAEATEDALRTELDIHSPSRALMTIGKYAVMGLAQGFVDNSNLVEEAASRTANNLVANIQSAIQKASEMAHDSLDMQPTIRPVMDLSNIEASRMKLDTMFSRSQAMSISARMSRDTADERQNGATDSKAGNTYQFTQINNSPKALSRAEIYRQTKNQFTALKEVLE